MINHLGVRIGHRWPVVWLALWIFVGSILAQAAHAQDAAQDAPLDAGPQPAAATEDGLAEAGDEAGDEAEAGERVVPRGINFLVLLTKGGWFMIPLAILSVVVVMIGLERLLALRRERVFPQPLIDRLAEMSMEPGGLDPRKAYQVCQQYPSSASQVLRSMLIKVGRPQVEIENAVVESSQREATRLSQPGSWLSLAAAIAPLIGLLGTVWGITQAFYDTTQMVAGENRAEVLAQGIYTALVTTLCGLMIAIPAAILSHFFENRVLLLMNEIEEMIFNLLPQVERYEGKLRFSSEPAGSAQVESQAAPSQVKPAVPRPERRGPVTP
ncbi:MAG: MotA/TolQ/ExbB proton channel family protein [Mariniblastus sp.]|nr:MotA/TolQ/ExbB proton channel family protein [Mariniblastus sp.]